MAKDAKSLAADAQNPDYILTPMLNSYLMQHGNDPVKPEIMQRVVDELTKPGRNRSGSFSASATGTCLRRQEFGYLGKPQDEVVYPGLQHTFHLGTWVGQQWAATLLQADLIEDIEVPLSWGRYRSMGSADGKGYVWWETVNPAFMKREFIWENKTAGEYSYKTIVENMTPLPKHIKQVTRYGLVSGIDLGVITYVDKGNVQGHGWQEFVIEITPEMKEESRLELEELNNAVDTKTLHPVLPGCRIKQGADYKYCPFAGAHGVCLTTKKWG
jgi:hypothetical protein